MKNVKLVILVLVLLTATAIFAQNAQIRFTDSTTATRDFANLEYPGGSYPAGTGNNTNRWKVRYYLSVDNVIDPLVDGQPTNDDTFYQEVNLNFAPGTAGTLNLPVANIEPSAYPAFLYARVFNAINFADATKYMTFTATYEVSVPGPASVPIMPDYGWKTDPVWSPIASTPPTYTLTVNSNYPGAAIHLDGADTGQVTPYTFDPADAGTYTVVLPNVEWTPPEYDYDAEADETANFVGVLNPAVPTITFPEEAQVFTWEAAQAVTITWENGAIIPDYYEYNWNGGDWLALAAGVTEWTTPELEEGAYNFQVRGVIEDPTLGSKTFTKARFTTRNASNSPKGTGAVATVSFSVVITPAADIPEDIPTPVGDAATVTISGGSANYDMEGDIPPIPNGSIVIADQFVLELIGAGPWTITIQTTAPWASYYSGGMWHAVENSGGSITFTVTASKDMDLPVVLADLDPTLPVELSAFNAVLTAQYFVKLTWISESETGLLGYRIYRSEDNVYDNAVSITPIMIDATNTSSTHVYTHEDREVMNNTGYYYWLEAVDMTHSTPYGPQYVEVKHDETPELPAQTVLKSAYPNPFKANSNTNIPVEVKAGESGTVTIYNVLGQVVKTFNVNEGFNPLTWNGRDSRNNACGSGIYFYKLSTPSKNQTKKMVIVK